MIKLIIQRWFLRVIFWPILWTLQFYDSALWWWHSARGGRIRKTNQRKKYDVYKHKNLNVLLVSDMHVITNRAHMTSSVNS